MSLEIKEIQDKNIWENFLEQCEEKTFLISWNWGEFNKKMGYKIWRLGIYDNGDLINVALVIKVEAKRGTFLFLPHSPVLKHQVSGNKYQVLEIIIKKLKELAKEEKVDFIRISPIWERNEGNIKIFKDAGFRGAPIHTHAEITWELDITKAEEELLKNMRKTTRYLIRRAPKDGVEIIKSKSLEDLEKFSKLYKETVDRHHFVAFPPDYLKNQFLSFADDEQILIFLAKYQEKIISSAVIVFWQEIGFYHHGASSEKCGRIPASYLLQWEVIKEAKKRGFKKYNFWGIAPTDTLKHPWAGLTLFKKGFGGYPKEYVKTQDLPLSWKYWLIYLFEKIRKLKRRL